MNTWKTRDNLVARSILIFLSVFLPALLIVVLVSVGNYRREVRAETALIEKNEELLIGFERTLIANQLNGVLEDLKFLAGQANLTQYLSSGFDAGMSGPLVADYESFLQRKRVYRDLRVIDLGGMEKIRVEYQDGNSIVSPDALLSSLDARHYFQRALELPESTIYVSRLDLSEDSIGAGEPIIRFLAPVQDQNGNWVAILSLSYKADHIIRRIEEASTISFGRPMLLDPKGFRLYPEGSLITFGEEHPDIWESVIKMDDGISRNDEGIFVFSTVYPLLDPRMDMPSSMWTVVHDLEEEGYYWYLVSYVPLDQLFERTSEYRSRLYLSGSAIVLAFFLFSLVLSIMRWKRILAESRIVEEASIFANNPAPVLRADVDGRIIRANPAAHRVFPGKTITDQTISVFTGLDLAAISDTHQDDSYQFEQKVGESYYFFTVKRDLRDGSLLFYGSDITGRKEIQKEITRLSTAVEQSATAILITDLEGNISFANNACFRSSGYSVEELIGRHTRLFKSGKQGLDVYKDLWETIAAGKVWTGEMHNRKKNGELYWEEMSITPIRDDTGAVSGYLAVKEDITRRKETEEELTSAKEEAESASRLKSEFLANMSHEIRTPMNAILGFTDFLIDDEQNDEKLKNLTIIKSSGKHLLSLINDILDFSKIEADRIDIQIAPFALRGTLEHIEGLMKESIRSKGLYLRTELSPTVPAVVEGDEHRITQILLNVLGNAVKFTAGGGITIRCDYQDGAANIVVSDTGMGIAADLLEVIFDPFEQASTATERTHGGTGLGLAICRRLADLMGGSIHATSEPGKGSAFILQVPLHEINAGEAELLEAVDDLPDDTPDGPQKKPDGTLVTSWLRNAGPDEGLQRVVLKGIRDLPVKLEKLKLAVAERNSTAFANIVHDLKGYTGNLHLTEVFDAANRLFEFTRSDRFSLGDTQSYLADLESIIRKIPDAVLDGEVLLSELLENDAAPFRILTAEDNETNRDLMRILLGGIGLDSDFVGDGREALSRLRLDRYDLLLLDMQMPVMDGLETIQAIRADDRYRDLHVIAITAHAMEGDADRYMELGCNDYLSKPIDRDLFAAKVTGVMNQTTGHREIQTEELVVLLRELKENLSIFSPSSVLSIGRKLQKLSSSPVIQTIAKKLQDAARDFDDGCVEKVIRKLEEVIDL